MTLYYCNACQEFGLDKPREIHDLIGNDPYPMYQYHEACPLCGEWDTYEEYTLEHALEALEVVLGDNPTTYAQDCAKQLREYLQNV